MAEPSTSVSLRVKSTLKQRKVRKGTLSCWECRHRKIRCRFEPEADACSSCRRQGVLCLRQDVEEPKENEVEYEDVERRIRQVEDLATELCRQRGIDRSLGKRLASKQHTRGDAWKLSNNAGNSKNTTSNQQLMARSMKVPPSITDAQNPFQICRALSRYLFSTLPPTHKAALILTRGKYFTLSIQIRRLTTVGRIPASDLPESQVARIAEPPPQTAHPIKLARRLMELALCLQQIDLASTKESEFYLEESARDAAARYVEASLHVTSHDVLLKSLDGLETLMLEASYRINMGELHTAWLLFRRALTIAQDMDLQRTWMHGGSKNETSALSENLWFRLVACDRFLSLILGLPLSTSDNGDMIDEKVLASKPPSERMDRKHLALSARIVQRNLRLQQRRRSKSVEDDGYDDLQETEDIDHELKQTSRLLPPDWWLPPSLNDVDTDYEVMARTGVIVSQMHQYLLVFLLHEPYIFPNFQKMALGDTRQVSSEYTYNKLALRSAGCEILTRYLIVRKFHRTLSYRGVDDKGYMACIILLFIHLDSHRLGRANFLEHHRQQDLGILHTVIACMEEMSISHPELHNPSRTQAQTLRKLMLLEADAAHGIKYDVSYEDDMLSVTNDHIVKLITYKTPTSQFCFTIPYFGTIKVAARSIMTENPCHMLELPASGRSDKLLEPSPTSTTDALLWQQNLDVEDSGHQLDFISSTVFTTGSEQLINNVNDPGVLELPVDQQYTQHLTNEQADLPAYNLPLGTIMPMSNVSIDYQNSSMIDSTLAATYDPYHPFGSTQAVMPDWPSVSMGGVQDQSQMQGQDFNFVSGEGGGTDSDKALFEEWMEMEVDLNELI